LFIEMTGQEINLLQQCRQYLQDWGIICSVRGHSPSGHGNGPRDTLSVGSLPPSIAERCRTEPRFLIDILRHEAWRFHDTGTLPSRPCGSTGSRTAHPWVGLFRDCPRGILDLLHSRSCRSKFSVVIPRHTVYFVLTKHSQAQSCSTTYSARQSAQALSSG
jgi:DNA mismatch repair protein MLH3